MSSTRIFGALVVAILISVACGGGSGESTAEEYFRLTDELSRTQQHQAAEINLEDYPGFESEVDDAKAVFEQFARIENEYEAGLSSVRPPDELLAMHEDLLDNVEQRLDALNAIVDALSDADASADVNDLAEPILSELNEAVSGREEACRALNEFAVANGISEGDPCASVFQIEGAAMEPTFESGDLLDVYLYRNERPQRGDIVVFNAPTSPDRLFIKRIIGVPGDEIVIDEANDEVSINGVVLDEPYIQGTTGCGTACVYQSPSTDAAKLPSHDPRARIPSQEAESAACQATGCYFVMGDNRQNSSDSRQGWLVPAENISGWVTAP